MAAMAMPIMPAQGCTAPPAMQVDVHALRHQLHAMQYHDAFDHTSAPLIARLLYDLMAAREAATALHQTLASRNAETEQLFLRVRACCCVGVHSSLQLLLQPLLHHTHHFHHTHHSNRVRRFVWKTLASSRKTTPCTMRSYTSRISRWVLWCVSCACCLKPVLSKTCAV